MNSYMYVYILKCSDDSYYTGVTNNIERRITEHNSGINSSCYTFSRRPLELVFLEKFQTAIEAISMEKKLKGWSRKKKEALINGDWSLIHEYSKCNNSTAYKKN
jgi:putative endonuclease